MVTFGKRKNVGASLFQLKSESPVQLFLEEEVHINFKKCLSSDYYIIYNF